MTVSNGQLANSTTFNQAFSSRLADDNTVGKKDLQNTDPASGPDVINVQREINSLNSFTGRPSGSAWDDEPIWTENQVGTATDTLLDRGDALTERFDGITGHTHDGTDGQGALIDASDLTNVNNLFGIYQYLEVTGANGSTYDVSTEFTGRSPGGDSITVGVLTDAPINKVSIIDLATGTAIEDAGGQRVYARITESAGVWTLSFYTNEAGVETAHTLASTNIGVFFREVFNQNSRPTIPADVAEIGSLDLTADVVDASPTQRGLVSTSAQSFAGRKTFEGGVEIRDDSAAFDVEVAMESTVTLTADRKLIVDTQNTNITLSGNNSGDVTIGAFGATPNSNGASLSGQALSLQPADGSNPGAVSTSAQTFGGDKSFNGFLKALNAFHGDIETDSTTTGANQTLATPANMIVRVTDSSLTSIEGITAPTHAQFFVLINLTGNPIDLIDDTGTAANRIITGTAADLELADTASVWLAYDLTSSRWRVVSGSGAGGGGGQFVNDTFTSNSITTTEDGFQKWTYTGSGTNTLISIAGFANDGQVLRIVGTSDTNTITLDHNDVLAGWLLNGSWVGYRGSVIELIFDFTIDRWVESFRNE